MRFNSKVFLDPSREQIEELEKCDIQENASGKEPCIGQLTIGYQPSLEQLALISHQGHMPIDLLTQDARKLAKICSDIAPNVHLCLVESLKN